MAKAKKLNRRLNELSPALRRRLEFVELLAFFNGTVSRDEIMNRFSISAASATNTLSIYNQIAPDNLSYDVRQKWYEISESFKPLFSPRMLLERIPVYTLPLMHNLDDGIERVAAISRAIQRTQSLSIEYSSASSGRSWRQIVPVAFANNLLRWHLRAYDRRRERYADFVLSRILEVQPIVGDTIKDFEHPENDKQWHTFIDLEIAAHPYNLADAQSFALGIRSRSIRIRAAIAGYFLQLWNVDCSPGAGLRGSEYQYVLTNVAEISQTADLELAPGYDVRAQPHC